MKNMIYIFSILAIVCSVYASENKTLNFEQNKQQIKNIFSYCNSATSFPFSPFRSFASFCPFIQQGHDHLTGIQQEYGKFTPEDRKRLDKQVTKMANTSAFSNFKMPTKMGEFNPQLNSYEFRNNENEERDAIKNGTVLAAMLLKNFSRCLEYRQNSTERCLAEQVYVSNSLYQEYLTKYQQQKNK